MSKSVKSQEKELKVSTFVKICVLLCIGNLITVTRIHMFDQILVVAEDYFNKSIQDDENSHHYFVPKITNFEDITTLATDLRLEQGYLLPFTMEIGALIIVTVPCFKRQGFLSLLFLLIANLVSFTALLINPHNFLIYRITYAIQSAIVYPMITLSSLSVMKAIPLELVPIKGYYSCLMFILPQLGRAIASYFFNVSIQTMENSTQILHTSLTRLLMVGTFFTFMAFFVIFQSKKKIKQTLDQRLNDAIEIAKIQHFSDEQNFEPNKQILKQKLKFEYEALMFGKKQGIKIFEKQQLIKGGDKQKRQQKAISILRQNTGTLIMVWGVAFAIGNQVMDLKKQFLTTLTLTNTDTDTDKRQEMEAELRQSNIISEILIFSCSIVISFIMIKLIRAGKVQSLRLVSFCYIVGYFSLLLLFMMANNIITMHLWSLHLAVLATRVSFFVFIVPTFFDLQQAGISAFEGVNILLLINWALEIIFRVGLMVFGIQAKVFALACIVVVCCFYLDRIDKQIKNTIEQPVEYNKIQEGETYDETEMTEDEDTIEPSSSTDTDNKGVVVKN